jgi:hypothetical protein
MNAGKSYWDETQQFTTLASSAIDATNYLGPTETIKLMAVIVLN